jgi:hypothetical protein
VFVGRQPQGECVNDRMSGGIHASLCMGVGDLECAVGRSECDEVESRLIPLDPTTGTSVAMHVWVSPVYASQQLSPRHCSYTSMILHTHGGGGVGRGGMATELTNERVS